MHEILAFLVALLILPTVEAFDWQRIGKWMKWSFLAWLSYCTIHMLFFWR